MFGKISHGVGPQSGWDYFSVWLTIAIAVVALYFTIRWIIKPKEGNTDHIKYSILTTEQP